MSLQGSLSSDTKCSSLQALYLIVDTFFENKELFDAFKFRIQNEIDSEKVQGDELVWVEDIRNVCVLLSKMIMTQKSNCIFKEFIASYIRICDKQTQPKALNRMMMDLKEKIKHGSAENNEIYSITKLVSEKVNYSRYDLLNKNWEDHTRDFFKKLQKNEWNGGDKVRYFNPENPVEIIEVTVPDEIEEEDLFQDFEEFNSEAEYGFISEDILDNLTYDKIRLDKSGIPTTTENQKPLIKYYGILNFDLKDLCKLMDRNNFVLLETNVLLEVGPWVQRELCKIVKPNNPSLHDAVGLTYMYLFANFRDLNVQKEFRKLQFYKCDLNLDQFNIFSNQEQNYKKINGKYVKMNKAYFMQMVAQTNWSGNTTITEEDMEYKMILDEIDFASIDIKKVNKVLSDAQKKQLYRTKLDERVQSSELDDIKKRLSKVITKNAGKYINWKEQMIKFVFNSDYQDEDVLTRDFVSYLKNNLNNIDFQNVVMDFRGSEVFDRLTEMKKVLGEKIDEALTYKTAFNVFGYTSDIHNELAMILGPKMNGLLSGKIPMKIETQRKLLAFTFNIKNFTEKLCDKNENDFYFQNDHKLYTLMNTIYNLSNIDPTSDDSVLSTFLDNTMHTYVIDREEYINKTYPRKKMSSFPRTTRSKQNIMEFKEHYNIE